MSQNPQIRIIVEVVLGGGDPYAPPDRILLSWFLVFIP